MEEKKLSLQQADDKVVQALSEMIRTGQILPGGRFPSERKLAEQFSVSRPTIRVALHYFETLGIIETRVGSGSYLVENTDVLYRVIGTRQLIEQYNWREMLELRQILEIGIVGLAAERATRDDKLRLRRLNAEMEGDINAEDEKTRRSFLNKDYCLHREFAIITRNGMLLEMFEAIKDTFLQSWEAWETNGLSLKGALVDHSAIIDAIIAGDASSACKAMSSHLDHIKTVMGAS